MNANEVIARLAGAHPNDHVNLSQSSNDVIPTAIHVAAADARLSRAVPRDDGAAFDASERELTSLTMSARLDALICRNAVPIRLGQEFSGYARQVELSTDRVRKALDGIYELPRRDCCGRRIERTTGLCDGNDSDRTFGDKPSPRNPSSAA